MPLIASGASSATAGPTGSYWRLPPLQLFTGEFLTHAVVFFVLAIVAALVGLRGVAGISMEIARILVLVFLVLAVVSLVL